MRRVLTVMLLLILLTLTACVAPLTDTGAQQQAPAPNASPPLPVSINGVGVIREVASDRPVILDVNGAGHEITVARGTNVSTINANGQDIVIKLPRGEQPAINQNGINIRVEYY